MPGPRLNYDRDEYVLKTTDFSSGSRAVGDTAVSLTPTAGKTAQILGIAVYSANVMGFYIQIGSTKYFSHTAQGADDCETIGRVVVNDGETANLVVATGTTGAVAAAFNYSEW